MGDQVRTDREIVKDIRHKISEAGADAPEARISELIEGLRNLESCPPLTGFRKDNTRYARKLSKWLQEGENLLKQHPKEFNFHFLFAPEPSDNETIHTSASKAELRYEFLRSILIELRSRCEWIIKNKFGEHRLAGYQQERAATASRELMEQCGLPLAYSSPTSPYRRVASLFFEAMTGMYDEELERACEAMSWSPVATEK
jgi:hypothetical protein